MLIASSHCLHGRWKHLRRGHASSGSLRDFSDAGTLKGTANDPDEGEELDDGDVHVDLVRVSTCPAE